MEGDSLMDKGELNDMIAYMEVKLRSIDMCLQRAASDRVLIDSRIKRYKAFRQEELI